VIASTGTDPKLADALNQKYVRVFASRPREPEDEVTPSPRAALFVLHDDAVLGLLKPGPAISSSGSRNFRTRMRSTNCPWRFCLVGRVAWALLASLEFRVNH
jgi:hypothetical protein